MFNHYDIPHFGEPDVTVQEMTFCLFLSLIF